METGIIRSNLPAKLEAKGRPSHIYAKSDLNSEKATMTGYFRTALLLAGLSALAPPAVLLAARRRPPRRPRARTAAGPALDRPGAGLLVRAVLRVAAARAGRASGRWARVQARRQGLRGEIFQLIAPHRKIIPA